jgi:DNA polymerase III subunit delta
VATFRAAYLIHGDDHGRVAERRARLRAMAEAESGSAGVELLEGDACTPDAVVSALSVMSFALGRRFVIADGVERWKEGDVAPVAAVLEALEPDAVTVAFFAREEGRLKAPAALHKAVEAAGGQIAAESAVKPRDLPRWVVQRAGELGLELDTQAARALVAHVGDRQQRLLRELEKLALEHGAGARIGVEEVQDSTAGSAERKVWTLADALVAGDRRTATRALLELRQQGERLPSLSYGIVRRLRDALAIAEALAAGQSPAQIKKGLRMPGFAADRLVSDVAGRDVEGLRRALTAFADLEVESRGGGDAALGEETAALRAILVASS